MHSFEGRESQQCDFLTRLLHADLKELQQAVRRVKHWLATMGLHLHADKTRFTHTLTPYQGQVGFDFLGFCIRQELVEKMAVSSLLGDHKGLLGYDTKQLAKAVRSLDDVGGFSGYAWGGQEHASRIKT